MADYEPPSFSLGFDLGFDSELQTAGTDHSTPAPAPDPSRGSDALKPFDVDEEIGPQITGPDPEIGPRPVRPLKRLKRGLALKREPATPIRNIDDDIEEFSSPEDIIRGIVKIFHFFVLVILFIYGLVKMGVEKVDFFYVVFDEIGK